jgi:hypothetical protein
MVTRYPVRWFIGLLAIGALLLAGCDSDDDTCNITDARVSQANSVLLRVRQYPLLKAAFGQTDARYPTET